MQYPRITPAKYTETYLFHEGGRNHMEPSPLICRADQWTGFYLITASGMKELNVLQISIFHT